MSDAEIRGAGDSALLVELGAEGRRRAPALLAALKTGGPGIVHVQPADGSVLVRFDPLRTGRAAVIRRLRALLKVPLPAETAAPRVVVIPVCYEGGCAPDLAAVAARAGLTAAEAAALHASAEYRVDFLGFMPGFAYLSGLPERLAAPRLETPRPRVPAGSVGIGGGRTAVYPCATPGGWRLIGRTPLALFDPEREPMSLLAVGDVVRFRPVPPSELAGAPP